MADYRIKRPLFLNGRLLPGGTVLAFNDGEAPSGAKLLRGDEPAEIEEKKAPEKQLALKDLEQKPLKEDAKTFTEMNKGK